MNVLVACEFSGIVRDAFLARGHDAVSCDLIPSERPGPHMIEDVLECMYDGWDMMIAFPPCTHLAASGSRYWKQKQANFQQQAAIEFVRCLFDSEIEKVAVENPVGILSKSFRKPDQYIEPYQFGHPYMKKTCLWLKGLPILEYTKEILPTHHWVNGGQNGMHRSPALRSKTFSGIAVAMADQWGQA